MRCQPRPGPLVEHKEESNSDVAVLVGGSLQKMTPLTVDRHVSVLTLELTDRRRVVASTSATTADHVAAAQPVIGMVGRRPLMLDERDADRDSLP